MTDWPTEGIGLPMFTIYDHPRDFPNHFVVRLFDGMTGRSTPHHNLYNSLQEARDDIPPNCVPLMRSGGDDPVIIETWI